MLEELLKIGDRFYDKKSLTKEEKRKIKSYYKELTGKTLSECGPCYATAYQYFLNINQNNIQQMTERKFRMFPGKLISIASQNHDLTDANITDETAIKVLKSYPACIKYFKTFPENWKDLVGFVEKKSPEETSDVKEELGSKESNLSGKTKKELKEIAFNMGYPESEYKNLNQAKLVEYLLSK